MDHPIQCRCGTLKGYVSHAEKLRRGVCYCKDCQAFAHFLGPDAILDSQGGTEVIATLPMNVVFTAGIDALACMRLTPNGLLRWYARCCNTPVGNTPPNFKVSFVGLVHNCLENSGKSLEDSFGPIRMRVNTQGAKGEPKPKSVDAIGTMFRFARMLAMARFNGSYKQTPFFKASGGIPVVTPKVLSRQEREKIMKTL